MRASENERPADIKGGLWVWLLRCPAADWLRVSTTMQSESSQHRLPSPECVLRKAFEADLSLPASSWAFQAAVKHCCPAIRAARPEKTAPAPVTAGTRPCNPTTRNVVMVVGSGAAATDQQRCSDQPYGRPQQDRPVFLDL
jgi:hypothetical protein